MASLIADSGIPKVESESGLFVMRISSHDIPTLRPIGINPTRSKSQGGMAIRII